MGGCISTPRGKSKLKKRGGGGGGEGGIRKKRRGFMKNRGGVGNRLSLSLDFVERSGPLDPSTRDVFTASTEVLWFDSASLFESDSEEEFRSLPDDSEDAIGSTLSSPKDASTLILRPGEVLSRNLTDGSVNEMLKFSERPLLYSKVFVHESKDPFEAKHLVYSDDMSPARGGESQDDCSVLPHSCLPCLHTSVSSDRSRSGTSSPLSARNKVVPRQPLMPLEGDKANNELFSTKPFQKRHIAGSLVPVSPIGKDMFDSWSPIEPSCFRVRSASYLRDKKKEHASSKAAYYPFGMDIFKSHRKINHISRLIELPSISSSGMVPALLVVNVQIPLYSPTLFQNENDGEGINVVMYFKLSDKYEKELPSHFQEGIKRLIDNEVEKVKVFPVDATMPFRERLKILGRVSNVDDLQLNVAQRKLMHAYNEKPILSRPQHEFYTGKNYFEIDLDMHRFSFISRKGFDAFQDKLKACILDVGLTIQGNKVEELPEQVLCCIRINGIDHTNYDHLDPEEESL